MTIIFIIAKIFLSLFLIGILISGLTKLSPSHRNPEINPEIEKGMGVIGLCIGLIGLYFTWFD